MTTIMRITFGAGAWMARPARAVMPIVVSVQGRTTRLVPDLARTLGDRLDWGVYGDTIIPADAAPQGTVSPEARIVGGLVVSLDSSQPAPDYGDGSARPEGADVRLLLTQPTTEDLEDLDLFLDRRESIEDVLAGLTGTIGDPAPAPPPPPPPRAFTSGFSKGFS